MAQRPQADEDVPDLVKTKHIGDEVEFSGDVNQRADCVEHTAGQQPEQRTRGHGGEHLFDGKNGEPAHYQIDACGNPARRIDDEHLDDDPGQPEDPDDCQKSQMPKPGKEIQAKRSVAAGNQQIDRGMVHFTQPQQRRWIGVDGMVKGAGGEHQDKRQTINQQRELFDGAAPTENEQRSQTHYGEQCRNQMYPGTDRVTKFTHETYPIGPRKFTPG